MEELRRSFDITNISAEDLEDVRIILKMKVYAIVSVFGDPFIDPNRWYSTAVDYSGRTCPKWSNTAFRFTLHDASLPPTASTATCSASVSSRASLSFFAMKKRNHEVASGFRLLLLRRRRLQSRLRLLAPVVSAVFGVLFLLFALFSLLAPISISINELPVRRNSSWGIGLDVQQSADRGVVFRVPAAGGSLGHDMWTSRLSKFYYGCSNASAKFSRVGVSTQRNGYLLISTSGGLSQQRTGITDVVVAVRILNATLVVPKLDQKSFWKDSSNFGEIFDVDWFISFLYKDVKIIKQLPKEGRKIMAPYTMRVPRKCTPSCYQKRVLPVLTKKHAVELTKFDYRLSNKLDVDLQKLRCRVNYHALKFTDPILEMGKKLVERMRMKSKHFIALHLRFESDMLAFSGCYYGGGDKERTELGSLRKRWKTLHIRNPDKERRQGKCPLTPEEVGLMLRALGFGRDVHIYVASGEVYGGEATLAPLKALFPNFHSKDTIASEEELSPFSSFSSRMAALDFIVCDESDVFVTNNNGNMARMLAGRRRYFGHKPTIRPNAKKLYRLFMNRSNMTWEEFASGVRTLQIGFMGEPKEVRPGRGEFHENPSSCLCEHPEAKAGGHLGSILPGRVGTEKEGGSTLSTVKNTEQADEQPGEDEHDWTDMDYSENENGLQGKGILNLTDSDLGLLSRAEAQPELEEMFSD